MSLNSSSDDPRVAELRQEQARRQARFFTTYAVIEGAALAIAAVFVYVLQVVDPDQGIWILVAVAVLGGIGMTIGITTLIRRNTQELREIIG